MTQLARHRSTHIAVSMVVVIAVVTMMILMMAVIILMMLLSIVILMTMIPLIRVTRIMVMAAVIAFYGDV